MPFIRATRNTEPFTPAVAAERLIALLREVPAGCDVVPNLMGNLAIRGPFGVRPGSTDGWYIGWIDLYEGRVHWLPNVTDDLTRVGDPSPGPARSNAFLGWVALIDEETGVIGVTGAPEPGGEW